MTDIVVRETSAAADGSFKARVDFGDTGTAEVTVSAPVDEAAERLLTWYFEEHLLFPFLDKDLEARAVQTIADYGRSLFEQVFAGEAAFGYRRALDSGFDGYRLVVRGSAAFHRLHWETLWDEDRDVRLALRMPVVRQDVRVPLAYRLPEALPTLNVLLVTARPHGADDIGYRTISQPLLDAIGQTAMPVTVDLVRPGTWRALQETLRTATRTHGSGWYQVVHFDLGGGIGADRPGPRAADADGRYLYFESATVGESEAVPSTKVAQLLAEHRVAVAVLQVHSEVGLAQDLVAAGAPVTIGMAYKLTVTAAKLAMPAIYNRLAGGADPAAAAFEARLALHDRKVRRGHFEQDLELEDWILPVVFAQRDSRIRLRPMTSTEQDAFYRRQEQIGLPPKVEYGFVGRDPDLHALERLLLTDTHRNQVLLRGMAGAGKSTLLTHAGWWWQRTGLVDQVFMFSYEQRAWTVDHITRDMAHRLLTPVEFAEWEAMSPTAQAGLVTNLLKSTRHLILLDNAESIAANPAAIPHALSVAERDRLAHFLTGLRGGRTLVLIGSREHEKWLSTSSFGRDVYELPGLDPQAAADLLERILQRSEATRWLGEAVDPQERRALADLMRLLDGYPLPMTVVIPQLASVRPTQVLAELQTGQDDADPTMAARRAIEYSHGQLDPALQTALLLLAPFTASIPVFALEKYAEAFRGDPVIRDLGEVDLSAAITEMERVGLATTHPTVAGSVRVLPILPYFLRNRLRQQPDLAEATDRAHYTLYSAVGLALYELLTSSAPERRATGQAVVAAEYANLTTALAYARRVRQPLLGLVLPLEEYLDHTQQHQGRRVLLEEAIADHPAEDSAQRHELATLHSLAGHTAVTQRRYEDARLHHQEELGIRQALGEAGSLGGTFYQLGRIALEQRRFEEAKEQYQRALDIYVESGERRGAASTLHQLGVVAEEKELLVEAGERFQQALDIYMELGERHGAARVYYSLGALALAEDRLAEAELRFQHALDIYQEFGDRSGVARVLHQLGVVAQARGVFEQAEAHYRQALDVKLEFGDQHGAALTFHQLGVTALRQGRFEQAEQYTRQALDIYQRFNDRYAMVYVQLSLGAAAEAQRRFDQAETSYQQALEICRELGDERAAANAIYGLGTVAEHQDRLTEAEAYYGLALETFRDLHDQRSAARAHQRIGDIAEGQSRIPEAHAHYQRALDIYLELEDRRSAAGVHQRLGTNARQERRFEEAEAHYRRALESYQEVGDLHSAARAYLHLGLVAQEQGRFSEAEEYYSLAGGATEPAGSDGNGNSRVAVSRRVVEALEIVDSAEPPAVEADPLPERLDLIELWGARCTPAEVLSNWESDQPRSVPIGWSRTGVIDVDVMVGAPDVLIVGAPRAGSTALLVSLVAAAATSNSPERLVFVILTTKGGDEYNELSRLPHAAGRLSVPDARSGRRALRSLHAEIRRRKQALADGAGRRGGESFPLPRLLVVVDELSAIADADPELPASLLSLLTEGHALGVRLMVASRRADAVPAELRTQFGLRIALRIENAADSRQLVGTSAAAAISPVPGRAVIQAGDVPIEFQAGFAGDGLAVLVAATAEVAHRLRIHPPRPAVAPPLPTHVSLTEVTASSADDEGFRVAFGLEDAPAEQAVRLAGLDLTTPAHLLVVGDTGSGRSQLLRTIAAAAAMQHSSADLHVYALDLGDGALAPVAKLPHCGAVVAKEETKRAARLFNWLKAQVQRREQMLPEVGAGTITEQRRNARAGSALPHVLLLIDGAEQFTKALGRLHGGQLAEQLVALLREGGPVGLHVVLAGDRDLLDESFAPLISERLALPMIDRTVLPAIGIQLDAVPSAWLPGRALRAGPSAEIQVAVLDDDPDAELLDGLAARTSRRDRSLPLAARPYRVEEVAVVADRFHAGDSQGQPVGREDVLSWLRDRHATRGAAAVLGPRRAGKTWVLGELARRLADDGATRVHSLIIPTPSSTVETRDELAVVLYPALAGKPSAATQLQDEAKRHATTADPLVFLLDELGRLQMYGPAAVSWLRDLGQSGAWLVYGGTEQDWHAIVRWALRAPGSSFGNDVNAHILGPLNEEVALTFLCGTAANVGVDLTEKTAKAVIDLVGTWPFYLQVVGDALVQAARSGDLRPMSEPAALRRLVERRLIDEWANHFAGRWREIGEAGRSALLNRPGCPADDLAPAQRRQLRAVGLLRSGDRWLPDPPFFAWIERNTVSIRDGEYE